MSAKAHLEASGATYDACIGRLYKQGAAFFDPHAFTIHDIEARISMSNTSGDVVIWEATAFAVIRPTFGTPPFGGRVEAAGGGLVTISVDRDTMSYPTPGEYVTVTPAKAGS